MRRRHFVLVCLPLLCTLAAACGGKGPAAPKIDGKTRSAWMKDLHSTLAPRQAAAVAALAQFDGPPLEEIAALLDRHGLRVRLAATQALGVIGPAAAKYAGKLAPLLETEGKGRDRETVRTLRGAAMIALGRMGKAAFKPIAHMLVSEDPRHRLRAVFTMRKFVTDLEDGTNTLLPLLRDDDANVRREAVRSIAVVGKDDPRASEALLALLKDDDLRVVAAAAIALGGIGGRSDHEGKALAKLLFSHQSALRSAAVYGLGLMGEEASPFIERVNDLLQNDGKLDVRIQAARAHYRIQGDAAASLPPLQEAIRGEDGRACREAARALREMGPAARPALVDLRAAAKRHAGNEGLAGALAAAIAATGDSP